MDKKLDLTARNFPTAEQEADSSAAPSRYAGPTSAYRLAFTDTDFLLREELRPVRMQLELLKPELVQSEQGIESTVVIFGSARLVSDDRTRLEVAHRRLLAKPVPELAGLIEVHGLGIRRLPYEPMAVVFMVIDLSADAPRLPESSSQVVTVEGISLPRLAVASGHDPMPLILAQMRQYAIE